MKPVIILVAFLTLGILTSCSGGSTFDSTTDKRCNENGCVTITIEHPIQAKKPVKIRLGVTITEKTPDVGISLTVYGAESIQFEKSLDATEENYKNLGIGWKIIDPKVNYEYIFEGTLVLSQPQYKLGMHTYSIFAGAMTALGRYINTSTHIYLDDDGNEMDTAQVKSFEETGVSIIPEVTGFINFPSDTPHPTFPPPTPTDTPTPIPTDTPIPTLTETLSAYP